VVGGEKGGEGVGIVGTRGRSRGETNGWGKEGERGGRGDRRRESEGEEGSGGR